VADAVLLEDKSGAAVNAEFLEASYKVAGGGWLSSGPDMAQFEAAMLADRVVKRATRDVMWTSQVPPDGLGHIAYGPGWEHGAGRRSFICATSWTEDGALSGGHSRLFFESV
jgi:hypothetical protein